MNHYGQMALAHWRTYRPVEYARMTDREAFFQALGEQIDDQIAGLRPDLEGTAPPGETFQQRVGRLNWAALIAREQVLREVLPMAEVDDAMRAQEEAQTLPPPR